MFTKEHLLQVIAEVPSEFSLEELAAILNQPRPAASKVQLSPISHPILAQANEWAYYTSPAAQAAYAKFPSSPNVRALRGIVAKLSPTDMQKTAQEWEAERIKEKYGV